MAKNTTKKAARPATLPARQTQTLTVARASLVDAATSGNVDGQAVPTPRGWDGDDVTAIPSGFAASPLWDVPGKYVEGIYKGMRQDVGPNNSDVYDLDVIDPDTGEAVPVTVWGGTVLTNKMRQYEPPVGCRIMIQYTGDGQAKPGQAPPRLFEVRWKAAK
jgi:hypothetical protein